MSEITVWAHEHRGEVSEQLIIAFGRQVNVRDPFRLRNGFSIRRTLQSDPAAILEKAGQPIPVPQPIANGLGRIRPAREPSELMREERPQSVDKRTRSCLARGAARIGTGAAHVLLDGIDLRNARNDFGSEMNEKLGAVAQKVAGVMTRYAQQNGYTLILDAGSQQQQSPILWAAESTNISEAVVQAYNQQSGVPAQPASAAAPRTSTTTRTPARTPAPRPQQ